MKKRSLPAVLLIVGGVILLAWADWLFLPAWNLEDFGFWFFLALCTWPIFAGIAALLPIEKPWGISVIPGILFISAALVISVASWLWWPGNDMAYQKQIPVQALDAPSFSSDFPQANMLLPQIDKELSISLAQGKLGPYGAQFQMNTDIFTNLAVARGDSSAMIRVSPLDYASFMVALGAGSTGTAGYLEVDQVSQESRLVEVPGGLKYTPNAAFDKMLLRHVRSAYKSALLGTEAFEIDDAGKPWWVFPVLKNTIGLFGGQSPDGIILVDPVDGALSRYARGEEPAWVDRTIPSSLVIDMANNSLGLADGWINRDFGSRTGVFQLSDGYNYIITTGSRAGTWLVSGITSPNEADQTLVGFMLVNLRTMEARRYSLGGITEMRAMEIAANDERVRAQNLAATWPILVDVDGRAAYCLMLKNEVQRQRFVFIDLADGRSVAMGESLASARLQFASLSASMPGAGRNVEELALAEGTLLRVRQEGSTMEFLLKGEPGLLYEASMELGLGVRFLSPGDRVEIRYQESLASPGRRFVQSLENLSLNQDLEP